MRRLLQLNAPNVALWVLLINAALHIFLTVQGVVQGEVLAYTGSSAVRIVTVVLLLALVYAHYLIINREPSALRWGWFWMVVGLTFLLAMTVMTQRSPAARPYDWWDVVLSVGTWAVVCVPLIRFRLVPAKRSRRH